MEKISDHLYTLNFLDMDFTNFNFVIELKQSLSKEFCNYIFNNLKIINIGIEYNVSIRIYGWLKAINYIRNKDLKKDMNKVHNSFKKIEKLLLENGSNFKIFYSDNFCLYINYDK